MSFGVSSDYACGRIDTVILVINQLNAQILVL